LKSNVSDHLKIMEAVYKDATMKCTADVSDLRDLMTIRSRVESEGISFLTITLPRFGQDFERCLDSKRLDPTLFHNFRKRGLGPAFLQGLIGSVFDYETGRIFNEEPLDNTRNAVSDIPVLVDSVRQICYTYKKIQIDCTPKRVQKALDSFVETEQSLQAFSLSEPDAEIFKSVSGMLFDVLVSQLELARCIPKHGPGATAERISGNQKFNWRNWHERLEVFFPIIGNGYPLGLPSDSKELENVTFIPKDEEQPVRVVPVPKTLKSPRIIAIEPSCMQYVQQGIRDELYASLESYWMTAGHINFRDQTVNQRLAIESSISGLLATIDLSDASDRVPRDLAMEMFRSNPDIRDAIDACRSMSAELPDGRVVSPLRKFASMGSALCFPVEAMYFYTICVIALLREHHLPVTKRNCYKVSRNVYVYGDDIIVPGANAVAVLEHLQKYNCKVNTDKTFFTARFRESCGVDAYAGEPVTPVYLRQLRPENRRQPERLVSWTATANLFYQKGYWHTASLMFRYIERIIGPLPYVSETSSALGRKSFLGFLSVERWSRKLHRYEILAWVPSPVYRTDRLVDYGALSKSLTFLSARDKNISRSGGESDDILYVDQQRLKAGLDISIGSSLERSALHGAVTLKRRWVPPT
jgi:hypothetical protein